MTTSGPSGSTSPNRPGGPQGADGSSSELLRALGDDVRSLVQQELRNAQTELTGKARRAGKGAAMLGGAAVLGAIAAGTSATVGTRALEKLFPRTIAAVVASALYAGGAAVLTAAGVKELRRALPVVPEQAVGELRRDVRLANDAGSAGAGGTPG